LGAKEVALAPRKHQQVFLGQWQKDSKVLGVEHVFLMLIDCQNFILV
jgi:hypothetical protein